MASKDHAVEREGTRIKAHRRCNSNFFQSLDAIGIKFYDSLYVELNVF